MGMSLLTSKMKSVVGKIIMGTIKVVAIIVVAILLAAMLGGPRGAYKLSNTIRGDNWWSHSSSAVSNANHTQPLTKCQLIEILSNGSVDKDECENETKQFIDQSPPNPIDPDDWLDFPNRDTDSDIPIELKPR